MLAVIATMLSAGPGRRFGASAGWARRLVRLASCRRAIAATEFALIAPLLMLLYAGAGEVSQAVMTSRKIEALSRTLVDLTSQQSTSSQSSSTPTPSNATTQAQIQAILAASTAILAPSALTTLTMTVSAIDIVNNSSGACCVFKVRWSYTQAGTLRPCGTNLTLVSPTQAPTATTVSSALMPPTAGGALPNPVPLLVADVSYTYTGPFSTAWINFPSVGMSRTSYMLPRTTGQIILGPVTATGTQSGAICY